jgi:hypothetical protein
MTYVFDIDGTICTNTQGDYNTAQPYIERINTVNKLYDEGNVIVFLTARGMGRTKNCRETARALFYDITKKQLKEWGVKYHELYLGKPSGDIYIDDKGERDENFFNTRD